MTLLLATTNPGKVREVRRVLEGVSVRLVTLADLAPVAEPEETGRTFAENAWLKARWYAAASGLETAAEDSGLVVDVLGGRPGVESARYPGATYAEKFANLYAELVGHPRPWTARFVCALAVAPAGGGIGPVLTAEGAVEGEIAPEPRGAHGFGYDPIFFYPPYGLTFGEVDEDRKLVVAHRGRAFRVLADWLRVRGAG